MPFQDKIPFFKKIAAVIFYSEALPSRSGSQEELKLVLKEQSLYMSIPCVLEAAGQSAAA